MNGNPHPIARIMCALWLLLLLNCSCGTTSSERIEGRVRISPRFPEEKVREQILVYTPIGSSEDDVMKFAQTKLKHGRLGPSRTRPDQLHVLLGSYGSSFSGSSNTWVQWDFDENGRLVRVSVSRSRDAL